MNSKNIQLLVVSVIGLLAINWASQYAYKRFDLTQDQRYTLSEAAKNTLYDVDSPIRVEVLLDENLPAEFNKLKLETEQLLQGFDSYNPNIIYSFTSGKELKQRLEDNLRSAQDAIEDGKKRFQNNTITKEELLDLANNFEKAQNALNSFSRCKGAQIEIRENGKVSTEILYPCALASYNGRTIPITLLKNQLGATPEERINSSIQNLEYSFADGFGKLTQPKRRKIAVLKGNGEMDDRYLADFISTLKEYYFIGQFTLDSVASSPNRTLESINEYDLLVVAQPTELFSEKEKYVLDQYIMNGGSSLWLIDATMQQIDTVSGNAFAFGQDLGLNDFFFKYGIRINNNLVKDIYAAPISLASGEGRDAQYNRYPWLFSPLSASANNHPVVTNIEAVKFDYASAIDTLPNALKKTVLLSTSPISKIVGLPVEIDIDKEIPKNLKIVNEGPNMEEFNGGEIPIAVLIEGEFPSVYGNRVKPFKISEDKKLSSPTKMIVVSDGDVIKNQLDRGKPLELGFDKWTSAFYGNKEFLLNSVNYLLDDSGLINIRTKEIAVPFLDPQKTAEKRTQWQLLNLLLPLGLLAAFGIFFQSLRKRKYRR